MKRDNTKNHLIALNQIWRVLSNTLKSLLYNEVKTIKRSENRIRKTVLFFALFLSLFYSIDAANPEIKKGSIKGSVKEKGTNIPLEYANVVLYNLADSSLIDGTIADTLGNFELNKIPNGSYYLEFAFIGYKRQVKSNVVLNNNQLEMENILLEPDNELIGEVSVTAQKSSSTSSLDKRVVNVSKNLTAIGGTAVDALKNAPSISTDAENNILLRGSSDFRVLINGKPSFLSANDVLRQTPADIIESIEIITNPSVKYSAEGTAGIINIILKSELKRGFNGQLNATIGTKSKYSSNATFNLNTEKLRLTTGIEWRDYTTTALNDYERFLYEDDKTDVAWLYQDRVHLVKDLGFRLNLDYSLSEKTKLAYSANTGYTSFQADMSHNTHGYTIPADTNIYNASTFSLGIKPSFFTNNFSWEQKLNDAGTQINANAYYSYIKYEHFNYSTSVNSDENFVPINNDVYKLNIDNNNYSHDKRVDIDFTHPVNENSKLETGLSAHGYKRYIDVVFTEYDQQQNDWVIDPTFTNDFDYKENIYAGYFSYSTKLAKIDFSAGLRAEYTDRELYQITNSKSYPYNKWHFFPSFSASKQLNEKHSLNLSYSHRINRPNEYMMNPFPEATDDYFYSTGNPLLLPEISHNLELGFQKILENGSFSTQLYYKTTTDKFGQSLTVMDDGRILIITENNREDKMLGTDLMLNYSITPWWSLNANASLSQYQIEGTIQDEYLENSNFQWNGNLVNSFNFKTNTSVQVIGMYSSKTARLQGELSDYYMVDLAVNQSFFNKRLSFNFQLKDILQSMNYELYTKHDNMELTGYFKNESPTFLFSVSYMFNNFKKMTKDVQTDFDM